MDYQVSGASKKAKHGMFKSGDGSSFKLDQGRSTSKMTISQRRSSHPKKAKMSRKASPRIVQVEYKLQIVGDVKDDVRISKMKFKIEALIWKLCKTANERSSEGQKWKKL